MKIEQIEYKHNSAVIKLTDRKQFEVSLEVPYLLKISSGQDIEDELFEKIIHESHKFDCEKKALRYVSMGMNGIKSELEIVNYLKKKKFENEIINQTVNRLKKLNYINDREFAVKFTDYKMRTKTVGLNFIKNELMRKGIKRDIIEEIVGAYSIHHIPITDKDPTPLQQLAFKKFEAVKNKKNPLEKVKMFLIGRGFNFDEIELVLKTLKSKMKSYDDDFEL